MDGIIMYTDGTVAFGDNYDDYYSIVVRMAGAGYQPNENILMVRSVQGGDIRFVAVNTDHTNAGFCQHDTYREVDSSYAYGKGAQQ